jgi:hypothetical protein
MWHAHSDVLAMSINLGERREATLFASDVGKFAESKLGQLWLRRARAMDDARLKTAWKPFSTSC